MNGEISHAPVAGGVSLVLPALRVRSSGILLPDLIGKDELQRVDLTAYRPQTAEWFDPERFIGRRGHKYFTHAARLASAAMVLAREDAGMPPEDLAGDEVGIALGANFAAHRALAEIDETVESFGVEHLSPLAAPHFSINLSASLAGIRTETTGFNVTLTEPLTAGLGAIVFARQALAAGVVARVIAGACEDEADSPMVGAEVTPRSGAAVFILERADSNEAAIVDALSLRLTRSGEARLSKRLTGVAEVLGPRVLVSVTAVHEQMREHLASVIAAAVSGAGRRAERFLSSTDSGLVGAVSPLVPLGRAVVDGQDAIVAAISPTGSVTLAVFSSSRGRR